MSSLLRTAFCGLMAATPGISAAAETALSQPRLIDQLLQPLALPALAMAAGAGLVLWFAPLTRARRPRDRFDGLDRDMPGAQSELRRIVARAKKRTTRLRARLRRDRPDLLPELATYEAMLNGLLRALAAQPTGLAHVRCHLEGELAALEKAAEKLSVVLGSASEEDAVDGFRFALVQMTGEAASCLAGLRSMATLAPAPDVGFLGGERARRV